MKFIIEAVEEQLKRQNTEIYVKNLEINELKAEIARIKAENEKLEAALHDAQIELATATGNKR